MKEAREVTGKDIEMYMFMAVHDYCEEKDLQESESDTVIKVVAEVFERFMEYLTGKRIAPEENIAMYKVMDAVSEAFMKSKGEI